MRRRPFRIGLAVRDAHPALRKGSGIFLHNDPADRPADVFAGVNTIHAGGDRASHLLIPLLPPDQAESNATVSVS
jgi:hypothetical protein